MTVVSLRQRSPPPTARAAIELIFAVTEKVNVVAASRAGTGPVKRGYRHGKSSVVFSGITTASLAQSKRSACNANALH
jgi:hypothetical protein